MYVQIYLEMHMQKQCFACSLAHSVSMLRELKRLYNIVKDDSTLLHSNITWCCSVPLPCGTPSYICGGPYHL